MDEFTTWDILALSEYKYLPFYDEAQEKEYLRYHKLHKHCNWIEAITYVNIGLLEEFYSNITLISNPDNPLVLVNKYRQLPSEYTPCDLEPIDVRFNPQGLLLRRDARIAFEDMCSGAAKEGLHLEAISTFRSFSYQNKVYLKNKLPDMNMEDYQRERDKVSARAGHSEHQTGLAVDINDLEQTFENTPEGRWLADHAHWYGFILRYPKGRERITGYDYEPWHFRYLGKELAKAVHQSNLTYDEYYIRYLHSF